MFSTTLLTNSMSTVARPSLTRLDKIRSNRKKSVTYANPPVVLVAHEDIDPLMRAWKSFCESAGPEGINNSFSYLLVQHPEVYWEYFRNAPSMPMIDDSSSVAVKNGKLNRHNECIHRVLDSCIKFALTNDLPTIESTLKRLGAYHAEFHVTGLLVSNFEQCLTWSMDMVEPSMSPHIRQIWWRIFEYIIRNMVLGINNYNDKVIMALTHKKITLHTNKWCGDCRLCGGQAHNELEMKRSYSTGSISDHK
ncbi:uncharacterized protein LOC129924236 isoform X2 [Biomphalaria glabrata]|uniref:Uncharacterized protein LOC129924236 isoform X2 n=1 Tax=Biomphalaria glabrata TaxID=6526 RepID=A0A9W2ZGF9_BIOGL|nr:uncharacterized protein LOC129924236 isoform X2 [Biomphalaria glabrata]